MNVSMSGKRPGDCGFGNSQLSGDVNDCGLMLFHGGKIGILGMLPKLGTFPMINY
jgi:hypothetical protein